MAALSVHDVYTSLDAHNIRNELKSTGDVDRRTFSSALQMAFRRPRQIWPENWAKLGGPSPFADIHAVNRESGARK